MQVPSLPKGLVRFGLFELDLRAGELRKAGLKIRLQEQPLQVLAMLLERPGEVVTREDLQQRLWAGDTFVDFENSLNKDINKIREALGDSAENPRFVETIPRRGYRFIAPVGSRLGSEKDRDAQPVANDSLLRSRIRRGVWLSMIGAIVLVMAAAWVVSPRLWRGGRDRELAAIESVAVLPFQNLSGDPEQEYFVDGMTDELISDLGKIGALKVISRTSMMQYKGTRKSLPEIANELDVQAVVEGSVLRSGHQVRITVQLIEAATDRRLWSDSYEGELGDVLALQAQVAQAIVRRIEIALTPEERKRLASPHAVNQEALEAYLKGLFFWNKRTVESLNLALGYFRQAVEKDPNYAPAYAWMADCYVLLLVPQGPGYRKEFLRKIKEAGAEALKLDSTLAEAHLVSAVTLALECDWVGAEKEYKQAIQLSPGNANARHRYSHFLSLQGRIEEGLAEARRALKLDPVSLVINNNLGSSLYFARYYDEAIDQLQQVLRMDPNFAYAHWDLGRVYLQKQMYAEAIAELEKADTLLGGLQVRAELGYAYGRSGKRKEAQQQLEYLIELSTRDPVAPATVASIYAGLGNNDQALRWLSKACDQQFGVFRLKADPQWDSLRSDKRFQDLLRRIGLG